MANPAGPSGIDAEATLDSAFAQRDAFRAASDLPRVGVFGNGLPETLVAAAGALPVHLSMGKAGEKSAIDTVIEPFVDDEVRTFLNRLMNGAFADCLGIVFARDDAPALIAYQYATEWVRQGRANADVPPLFLWNLVHTDSPAVRTFNAIQAEKLFDFLAVIGLERPTPQTISVAAEAETGRRAALGRIGASLSGATALRWRNAGRYMSAAEHAQLIDTAFARSDLEITEGIRLGVVGSPLACVATYEMLETFGPIVCDLQPWGSVWPGRGNTRPLLDDILRTTAADTSCPRINPTAAYRAALVGALAEARCDLVVCQLAQTDDTFGWEVPALAADLAAKGIGFINLGFRDAEPDRAWRDRAARLIATALEARP